MCVCIVRVCVFKSTPRASSNDRPPAPPLPPASAILNATQTNDPLLLPSPAAQNGNTALHMAARGGSVEAARAIMERAGPAAMSAAPDDVDEVGAMGSIRIMCSFDSLFANEFCVVKMPNES